MTVAKTTRPTTSVLDAPRVDVRREPSRKNSKKRMSSCELSDRQRTQEEEFKRAASHGYIQERKARVLSPMPVELQGLTGYALLDARAAAVYSPWDSRKRYTIEGERFAGKKLEAMRQDWLLQVLKRRLTSKNFMCKHGIEKKILNALKREYPHDFSWATRRHNPRPFSDDVVAAAVPIIETYHNGDMTYAELKRELHGLGVSDAKLKALEKQLPGGMRIARTVSGVYQQQRRDYFNGMADAIEALLEKHGWVVRSQTHLLQLLSNDEGFSAAFPPQTKSGRYTNAWLGKARKADRAEADGRLGGIFDRVKPPSKRGRRQPNGINTDAPAKVPPNAASTAGKGVNKVRGPHKSDTMSMREQLKTFAAMLSKQRPSEKALKATIATFAEKYGVKRSFRLWRLNMEKYKGVIPEFARWRVGTKNDYSLRYLARWVQATHQAGVAASEEQVAEIFKQSSEYAEDGRIPDTKLFSQIKNNTHLEWDMAVVKRGRWQLVRNMLEAIRTAPPTMDLTAILKSTPIQPQIEDYDNATYYLQQAVKGGKWAEGQDARVLAAVRNRPNRYIYGMGEKRDPAYAPNTEPPWFPLEMAEDILSIPRVEDSELFLHAIDRLDGKLPFENNHMMIVYHKYSDILPLMDLFIRAGMSPKNSTFVSTPYHFHPAFDLQLESWGVSQEKVPPYDREAFTKGVESGLRKMIKKYDEREAKFGYGRPILILDDGGEAAELIRTKFRKHAHKFKVVEVTAAGERITRELKEQHKRVPFVYYSIAYSAFKRAVTSRFYATRVVDRVVNLIDVSPDMTPVNQRVCIIGGGPMGRYAAEHWRSLGYEVAIVDKDADTRAELLRIGFDESEIFSDRQMKRALQGRGFVQTMCGYENLIGPQHLGDIADGAIMVQGSSKRNDFDMEAFEKQARSKDLIPRTDGLPQESFTYTFGSGSKQKQLHFVADGWTINHDGSLHGTPFDDVQLETVLIFESAVEAASDPTDDTGDLRVVGADVQEEYTEMWKEQKKKRP